MFSAMNLVCWHSLQVLKPVPSVFIYLVQYACNLQLVAYVVVRHELQITDKIYIIQINTTLYFIRLC